MKLIRSKEWWLRLAEREGDATVMAGVPDPDPNVRGPHNGWMTPEDHRQHLEQLARLKARLFSGGHDEQA